MPKAGPGRPKGMPNQTTALLKDAILKAAEGAGGEKGLLGYLEMQARKDDNAPFMALLGKLLPASNPINPAEVVIVNALPPLPS